MEKQKFNKIPTVTNEQVNVPKYEVHTSKNEELIQIFKPNKEVEEYYVLFAGKCISHHKYKSVEEAEKAIKQKPLEMIINAVIECIKTLEQEKNNETESQKSR